MKNNLFSPASNEQLGNSAEFYIEHIQSDSVLSHGQLLKDFGAEPELADDMLTDQGMFKLLLIFIVINFA